MKGVRICRVSTVPVFMATLIRSQIDYLTEIGMRVTLVSSEGPEWSSFEIDEKLSVKKINIPRSLKPWQDLVALVRLTSFFLSRRFDIVHSTTPKAGLLTALAAFIARVPVRLHTYTGQPWVTLHGPLRWSARLADRVIGLLSTKCYADSDSQAKFLAKEGILAARKIAVIGRGSIAGVDLIRFDPDKFSTAEKQQLRKALSIAENSKIIIYVGRITKEKGISELLAAFNALLDQNYDVDLILAGPQDQDCSGTKSSIMGSPGQCPRIHWIGYTDRPEKYLSLSDIFCLPSYREGFGTSVIEAAAMGLPTVGTRINGIVDSVIHGETGLLVPARDGQMLLGALKQLLDQPAEIKRMGKEARRRCFQYYDAEQINRMVAEEYVDVLKKGKGLRNNYSVNEKGPRKQKENSV